MRKHKIHHEVVTHEKELVVIISSFDLLSLLDKHKYTVKNPPTLSKKNTKQEDYKDLSKSLFTKLVNLLF